MVGVFGLASCDGCCGVGGGNDNHHCAVFLTLERFQCPIISVCIKFWIFLLKFFFITKLFEKTDEIKKTISKYLHWYCVNVVRFVYRQHLAWMGHEIESFSVCAVLSLNYSWGWDAQTWGISKKKISKNFKKFFSWLSMQKCLNLIRIW